MYNRVRMRFKDFIIELVETLITSFVIIYLIYLFVASVEVVWGSSMEPNFFTGERILVEKITKHFRTFKRGQIVVLIPPSEDSKHYIKRVIGVPGDIIKIMDCRVYISKDGDKFVLEENYLQDATCTRPGDALKEGRSLKLEKGEFFVMGDNRSSSVDSRSFGKVEKSDILGQVIFRFWPLNAFGFIK